MAAMFAQRNTAAGSTCRARDSRSTHTKPTLGKTGKREISSIVSLVSPGKFISISVHSKETEPTLVPPALAYPMFFYGLLVQCTATVPAQDKNCNHQNYRRGGGPARAPALIIMLLKLPQEATESD